MIQPDQRRKPSGKQHQHEQEHVIGTSIDLLARSRFNISLPRKDRAQRHGGIVGASESVARRSEASARGKIQSPRTPSLGLFFFRSLHRIFDGFDSRKLDIVQFPVHFLDLTDVDVLHDVARLWID